MLKMLFLSAKLVISYFLFYL